jgi:aminoglycoside phosphotransferase (APT) family kinase protein
VDDSLRARIAQLLLDPADQALATSILGTVDVGTIAARIEAFCEQELGAPVQRCELFSQSVGAVFVLVVDGRRVVLKAHTLGAGRMGSPLTLESLRAVYQVQDVLARQGFACARVLRAPQPWPGGAAAVMSFVDGAGADPQLPAVRTAMATLAAELVAALAAHRDRPQLPRHELPSTLWPRPHNVLFDLQAPGGAWIDDRAREARALLGESPAPPVLAHTDLSASNVRTDGTRITALYDMDSVAVTDEMRMLAGTAVHFTYTGGEDGWAWPTRDQARAFVADYERARGRPLDRSERRRLDAAAIYALAYTARCEHARVVAGDQPRQNIRQRLLEAGSTYLSG